MNYEFNGHPVTVIKSKRKTLSVQLKSSEIIVRVPYRTSGAEIRAFLDEKSAWIEKHQKLIDEREKELRSMPKLTADEIKTLCDKAACIIPEKVRHYASIVGVDYRKITIRCQRTLWGSCTSDGNLSFNCLLMLTPDDVIDSVVAHELCHRKQMNHSKAFYKELLRVYPDYYTAHDWLKKNGGPILRRIPQK